MTTATTSTPKETTVRGVEATADRIRELNERIIEVAKRAGESSLDGYVQLLETIARAQEQAGAASGEWLTAFGKAQARFTRELADALPAAARELGERADALRDASVRRARSIPGVARAEGEAKGAVASSGQLPIARYDDLPADVVVQRLQRLSKTDLGKIDAYERKHKARKTVLDKVEALRS